jgi:hypothetical protein
MQSLHDAARPANTDSSIPPFLDRRNDTDEILLGKINRAVAGLIVEELAVCKAHARLESKWKEVGELLIEAKRQHPQIKAFEAFLKRVSGLHRSRAYELMKIAGGGTTEEEVREVTRLRVRKHRAAKKKAPKVSVTHPPVTESAKSKAGSSPPRPESEPRAGATGSAEISIEQRKADMARLDEPAEEISEVDRRVNCMTNTIRRHVDGLLRSDAARFLSALRDRIDDIEREILRDADNGVVS